MTKVKKRKGIEAQRGNPFTSSQTNDALIGDEEQTRKQKKNKKESREQVPNPVTSDHFLTSYDSHGSGGIYERIHFLVHLSLTYHLKFQIKFLYLNIK